MSRKRKLSSVTEGIAPAGYIVIRILCQAPTPLGDPQNETKKQEGKAAPPPLYFSSNNF
jgi:hypothetical protein